MSTVTDEDRDDAQRVVELLTERYSFPVKAKFQEKPAVFGDAKGRNIVISIYGVIDTIEQERIVAIAEDIRKQINSKPIEVKFFQKEIWEHYADGSRRAARNKETLLYKYLVE